MKKVYFVRHGEAEGNVGGFSQVAATPLTEEGHEQARLVAQRFQSLPIEAVLASHMDRAQDTARYIADVKGLTVETTEYFHETIKPTSVQGMNHSSEEYQAYSVIETEHYTDPEWRYEDGENFSDLLSRVEQGISILEKREEKHIAVVSHGRLLRFLASYLIHNKQLTPDVELQTAASMKMTNTGITVFEFAEERWKMLTFNDHAHFAE